MKVKASKWMLRDEGLGKKKIIITIIKKETLKKKKQKVLFKVVCSCSAPLETAEQVQLSGCDVPA